ncbi:BTB/POZ domain-containing protein [Symbiodinium microadriaticum]|uniref:BTB/POZ domain-containing protein n=1 Tax=Symbiodinium microadriaticum TaxID=2951 RepID=A0A1Q9DQG2_SYMMI|nr:BTB/POZ domain-containing protein [Symbiodinium microadriaticum]
MQLGGRARMKSQRSDERARHQGHELANHQFLLQRMLGVWREFRAEQAVHRAYQAKIAELNVQFEDDLAELMHVQGMKMYNLRLALADLKASSERKLLFQYCMQKWDECKYQRSLEKELAQINERHEDELAELVHAQGLAKHRMIQTSQDRFLKGVMRQELQRHFLAWSHVKRLNISTAAELLTVAKAKQQLGKEMEVKDLKALRLKDHVVHHVSKTITFVRLKDIWLAWLHQVLLHRLEKTQDRKDRSHRKEIQRIRREAADEHTALGERMHSELEQVGRESYLRDMLLQWQAVVKNMRSHRNYHGEMDQIRQEAAQEVKQKEKKTVEQLSSFAIHSAELLIRRRMKEPLVMVFVNWRMVQEREKYQQHAARMQQEAQDQRDHHQNVLQSKETKKEVACWQLATFSFLVRERVIIRLAIFHYWREASMWSKKAHLHHLRRQGQEIASHSKEVSLLVTQMLAHQRDLSLLTKVLVQWKQVVEREANQRSLEQKDEENVERVKTSVHNERVAGSKRAQVLVKWLLHLVKYAKIVRKMEGDKEAHDLAMVEVENKMEKHQDALVPYWLRLKRQMVLMRYFPAFIFIPYMNHSEAHLQKTIEKLDKKRERQIVDLYKLRRKSVADAGEVLHFFRGQRENQLVLSLVLVIWSEVASDQMAMRRWNEQREVKLELERSLQELKDKTWHLRIDTKKGKDLTDTCRHMGEWTGQLLMELSTTRAWGCWRVWHLQEVHSRVQAKANNHTEARVMAERMKVQQRQKKDEVVMSNIMVAAGEISSVKFSFRAWDILTRKEKEHRLQKYVPLSFDWNQPIGTKQVPPLVSIMCCGLLDNKMHGKLYEIAEWLLEVGGEPGHKITNKSGQYQLCKSGRTEETKILVDWRGHSAVSFAFAMISQLQLRKGGADWSKEQAFLESLVALFASTAAGNNPRGADVTVPQSTLELWESMRDMTDSHNVIFQSSDGEVSAHDQILKAASPVLKAMLASAMKEGTSKRIEVKDSSCSGVSLFLDLLYTSSTREDPDYKTMLVALDLAHRWQVHGVVRTLCIALRDMIDSQSFLAIAEAAALKGLEMLERACASFGAADQKVQAMLAKGGLPVAVRKLLGKPEHANDEQQASKKRRLFRHKTNIRQDHKKELYELRQDTVAKLRASNSRENDMKDMQQVLRCFVCWCTDVKAGKMATDLLVAEEKKRQEVEAQMQQVQQDLTVEMSARKTAESEARTATELLHNNGIQFPTEPEAAAAARPERFMLPVERVAQALQKVYRRRLTTALVAMLTTSPRKMAWYQREAGDRQALADNPKSKRKAQSTAKPAASKAAPPAMLALPAPAATPGAPGGVASTLDFLAPRLLARTRQLVASSFDADATARGGRDIDDGFSRQGNGYPVPSLPRFGAQDSQVSPPESPGAFERPRVVAKPRPDSTGPHLVITGVKSPPPPPPSAAAGPTLPTRQTIEQQINLQDTLTHMQDTMRLRGGSLQKSHHPRPGSAERSAAQSASGEEKEEEFKGHTEQDDKTLRLDKGARPRALLAQFSTPRFDLVAE